MSQSTLIIRHVPNTEPPQFTVERSQDGKASLPVAVAGPNSLPVEGRSNTKLTEEIRWYLETFLDYPFPPDTDRADQARQAFEAWGKRTFTALFTDPHARRSYDKAVEHGFANLTLRIVSDSPAVLGWPWEALHDPEPGGDRLAHHCSIERRINVMRDPVTLRKLPTDRVNVLLVIARPLEGDVRYRSVSRSLVELAAGHTFPISVDVLRPPTFDQLREHLRTHPHHYHILHFDGHGAYRHDVPAPIGRNILMRANDAQLLFENEDGSKDAIESSLLSDLLREHAVPAVVLNACQSAAIDDRAADPFASVAAALLRAGTRSVVAMAYALYVSGAQQFLPAFYKSLFASGNFAGAVRAGRQMMLRNPQRVCARGTYPLEDWAVPVVYQQADPLDFSFVAQGGSGRTGAEPSRLPDEARDDRNPYGFVGRDGAVLELERALRRPPAAILITGLGGVGKTTLIHGFLKWLEQTNGLGSGVLWFDFRDVHSAEYVINRLGEAITGKAEFAAHSQSDKLDFLANMCKRAPVRIVWDNFESARGIPGANRVGNLTDADPNVLKELLTRLRGGATKVVITSRSTEEWLGVTNIGKPVAIGGLDGEERWEYANAVVRDLGLNLNREDPALAALMKLLRAHPLAMRVVLSKLAQRTAAQLNAALETNITQFLPSAKDESEAILFATLQFASDGLPKEWQPLLVPVGLHESYLDADFLESMAKQADASVTRAMINECLGALANAGLVRHTGQAIYELHPLLTSYLRSTHESLALEVRNVWSGAFVDVMGSVAKDLAPRPLHKQRFSFLLHEVNFYKARAIAVRLGKNLGYAALTQALAAFAQNTRNFSGAEQLFGQLQTHHAHTRDETREAGACHQLGRVAEERRDFAGAETWYRKSLEIAERLGNEHGAASTYHQLGNLAVLQQEFETAWGWFLKALNVFVKLDNPHYARMTINNLTLTYREARPETRPRLLEAGRTAGLPDQLLRQIEEAVNPPPPNGS
ncbi:CHAT domain-containing protein [Frigoriglobus tundricola]|uniref:CHAT domain-containing protein n=1 Tax=Frigoriglobus tundricola TaxID=2774151 RepID=A0A6M5Z3T0_9BACT|nr:CHAT domain-containing protein [Frigoriglobus tundricola]QJX00929.1 hypothetical protein FTUN_8567 [Frigoriglobus tundricola]